MRHCPKKIVRSLTISGILLSAAAGAAVAADPTGDWRVAAGVANIRVAECNGSMWGAVSWEKVPGGIDSNNADPAKQKRPTLGMTILFDMKKNAAGDTWEGQVYDAKVTGRLQKATIKPKGPDQLEIQGCLLFFCDGETWTRAGPPIPSSPSNAQKGAPKPAATKSNAMAASPASPAPPPAAAAATVAGPAKPAAPKGGATTGQPADPVGDICLLPEIARFPH
jgi:uncharacterized protein (DUF2147 family)